MHTNISAGTTSSGRLAGSFLCSPSVEDRQTCPQQSPPQLSKSLCGCELGCKPGPAAWSLAYKWSPSCIWGCSHTAGSPCCPCSPATFPAAPGAGRDARGGGSAAPPVQSAVTCSPAPVGTHPGLSYTEGKCAKSSGLRIFLQCWGRCWSYGGVRAVPANISDPPTRPGTAFTPGWQSLLGLAAAEEKHPS